MDISYLLENWAPCRAALHLNFPQYGFPAKPPTRDEFIFALDGLAVVNDLTPTELVDTLIDKMIFAPPQQATQKAA